jgi:cysteine desulfurase/selenocysteine lyase
VFVCDGAQSVPHIPVDVQDLDVDFLAFSGHKMGGPMGIGVLYGKKKLLDEMPPFLYGGEMIEYVKRDSATYAELPHKFEAGTVNAAGAVGLGRRSVSTIRSVLTYDHGARKYLSRCMMEKLSALPYVHILGSKDPDNHHGIYTFTVDGVHPHDIAAMLDEDGVDVRAGHHCAQPLMKFMHTLSTTRASVGFYNTEEEIDRLVKSLSTACVKNGNCVIEAPREKKRSLPAVYWRLIWHAIPFTMRFLRITICIRRTSMICRTRIWSWRASIRAAETISS